MNGILIVLLILLAIYAFGFTKPKTKGARGKQNTSAADMDDGAAEDEPGLDYANAYQQKCLFSYHEKDYYYKLKEFADRQGLYVFAKVRLLDLLEPRKGQKKYRTFFYKVQSKHVDFVLCNEKLVAKWVIELDDASHQQKDRAQRDSFVDMVLTNTGYKILHTENFNEAELKEFVS